ncbi:MAG TPA: hypothetical protein VGI64_06005 [Streptosporangiaceae bacterium]
MTAESVSDVLARRVREVRKKRNWTPSDLARRCEALGAEKLTENAVENIESGRRQGGRRRREITVDELFVLAYALDVAPISLLVPIDDPPDGYDVATQRGFIQVTPSASSAYPNVRAWIAGALAFDRQDARLYYAEQPLEGWQPPRPAAEQVEQHGTRTDLARQLWLWPGQHPDSKPKD